MLETQNAFWIKLWNITVFINYGKKPQRLNLPQISKVHLRALLSCFQDQLPVFHSSSCLHVNLHIPSGYSSPVHAPIMAHKISQPAMRRGSTLPNLVPLEDSLPWGAPITVLFFGVQWFTHTCTDTNGKTKVHVTKRNNSHCVIILQNHHLTNGTKSPFVSFCWAMLGFLSCFLLCLDCSLVFLVCKNQESLWHWKL